MNKKLITAVGLSSALMLGSAFVSASSSTGADEVKMAIKEMKQLDNLTVNGEITIKDNGQKVLGVHSLVKVDKEEDLRNMNITVDDNKQTKEIKMYHQDGERVIKHKNNDVYYVMENSKFGPPQHFNKHDKEFAMDAGKVFDALTVNLQNDLLLKESMNGSKEVELELSKSEIPAVAHVVTSFMLKHACNAEWNHKNSTMSPSVAINPEMPKLKDDIEISYVKLHAKINKDHLIETKTAEISISGKDSKGKQHEVTVHLKADLSDFNTTNVSPINLDGKKVEKVSRNASK